MACWDSAWPTFCQSAADRGLYLDLQLCRVWAGSPAPWRQITPLSDLDRQDLAAAGIGTAPAQPCADVEAFQDGNPALGPPAFPECAAFGLGLDAPFGARGRDGLKYLEIAPSAHLILRSLPFAGQRDLSARRSKARSASLRPFRRPSRQSPFCVSIISSIFSSRVPAQRNLCTCTFLVWPMRKARSVAWFSTAGFHQRSKWKTWLARVRFKPVPPALRERMKMEGVSPSSAWKRSTMRSRCFFGNSAVQEEDLPAEGLLQMSFEDSAHLGKLGEDQRPIAHRDDFLQHLRQTGQLSRAPGDGRIVAQELGRMVADLLQLGQGCQDHPLALDPFGRIQASGPPLPPPPRRATPAPW